MSNSSGNASGADAGAQLTSFSGAVTGAPPSRRCSTRCRAGAPFAVGDIEQTAYPTQERILQRVDHAIGMDDLPQHLHQLDPLLEGEAVVDDAGESEELGRSLVGLFRSGDELARRGRRKLEAALENAIDHGSLARVDLIVDMRTFDEQRCRGELHLVGAPARRRFRAALQPRLDFVEHGSAYHAPLSASTLAGVGLCRRSFLSQGDAPASVRA